MRKPALRELTEKAALPVLAVCAGVLFYELIENIGPAARALGRVLHVLRPVFIGIALAYAVGIPAGFFENKVLGRMKRRRAAALISAAAAYSLVLCVLALVLLLAVPRAIEGASALISNLGEFMGACSERIPGLLARVYPGEAAHQAAQKAAELVGALAERLGEKALSALPKLYEHAAAAFGFIADAFLAATLSVYLLLDKNRLLAHARRTLRALLGERNSGRLLGLCSFLNRTFRGYLSGQLISCIALGAGCWLGMRLFKMPYPELISLLTAVFALIPILGPWLSTLAGALIILVSGGPGLALRFAALILVVQQLENSFISPRLVGPAVGLSGAWVLLGVIIGGGLFGVTGLLLSVPVTAVLYRLAADRINARVRRSGAPPADAPEE